MALRTTDSKIVNETYKDEEKAPKATFEQAFDKTWSGTGGADTYTGKVQSSDLFLSSPGGDFYDGGSGEKDWYTGEIADDWVSYANSREAVTVDLKEGAGQGGDAKGDTYNSIENVIGSDHDDVLIGNDDHNILKGEDGNDRFVVSGGSDHIDGGKGFDLLDYSNWHRGVDVNLRMQTDNTYTDFQNIEGVIGSDHDDTFRPAYEYSYFEGRSGNDTLVMNMSAQDFEFHGGANNDTLDASGTVAWWVFDFAAGEVWDDNQTELKGIFTSVETLLGSEGNNVIFDGGGLLEAHGMGGNDTFHALNDGFDLFDGGDGIDTISFADAGQGINTGDLTLTVSMVENVENIVGTEHADDFTNVSEFSRYEGLGGNDQFQMNSDMVERARELADIEGGSPTLKYYGGEGTDTLTLHATEFTIDLNGFGDTGFIAALQHTGIIDSVENFVLAGSALGPTGTFVGDEADNVVTLYTLTNDLEDQHRGVMTVEGGGGDDTVHASFQTAVYNYRTSLDFDGGEGHDTLSYADSNYWLVVDSLGGNPLAADDPFVTMGIVVDMSAGTVTERRLGEGVEDYDLPDHVANNGIAHTFANVEEVHGTQLADVFIDAAGSQTYKGVDWASASYVDAGAQEHNFDTFVFTSGESDFGDVDTILDFTVGEDKIDLSGTNIDDWQELLDNMEQDGSNAVLEIGSNHELVLEHVDIGSLTESDFLFF